MQKSIVKLVVKLALGAIGSAMIGYLIKSEHTVVAAIDARWPDKPAATTTE